MTRPAPAHGPSASSATSAPSTHRTRHAFHTQRARRSALAAVLAITLGLGCTLAPDAQATVATTDVEGVKFDEAIVLQGSPLQLNGAGVRYRTVLKVYSAGLYLGHKVQTTEDALASPGPKRIAITMLRDVDAGELGRLFTRGVEDNGSRGAMAQLIPGLLRMSQVFSDQKHLKAGDPITLDWLPGQGTVITINGTVRGEAVKEPAFFDALLKIWIGANPADMALKNAMLGKG